MRRVLKPEYIETECIDYRTVGVTLSLAKQESSWSVTEMGG